MNPNTTTTTQEHQSPTTRGRPYRSAYHDLTAVQRDILTVLAGHDAPAGVAVRADLSAYYGSSVEPSRVYQALTTLADKHLVEITEHDGRTNAYHLTSQGERVLVAGTEFKVLVGGGEDE